MWSRIICFGLFFLWGFVIYKFKTLPELIPSHFNVQGKVDDQSRKLVIFLLPSIITVLTAGMYILIRFPYRFNYPVAITMENAERQYRLATRMIRVLSLSILVVFFLITLMTTLTAENKINGTGIWLLPVILLIVFVPLGIYLYHSFRNKK